MALLLNSAIYHDALAENNVTMQLHEIQGGTRAQCSTRSLHRRHCSQLVCTSYIISRVEDESENVILY